MSAIRLAGGPVSWGVDFAGAPGNPPYGEVLDGIAAAGLEWLELGPVGYLPPAALAGGDEAPATPARGDGSPATLARGDGSPATLASRGLSAVGTFVFDDFHRAGGAVLDATDAALDAIAAAGGTLLVLIDRPCAERAATAGRGELAPRLGARDWTRMVDTFRRAGERAVARGIRPVVHPHAGGYVEFEDEIDALLHQADLGLCLDTGHALYAGADPAALIRRHAGRLEHLHLKDVAEPVRSRGLGFWDAVRAGVFCPVGDGLLDLAGVRTALDSNGYAGFATVEQDRRPGSPGTPADDLRRSVARLRAAGIG